MAWNNPWRVEMSLKSNNRQSHASSVFLAISTLTATFYSRSAYTPFCQHFFVFQSYVFLFKFLFVSCLYFKTSCIPVICDWIICIWTGNFAFFGFQDGDNKQKKERKKERKRSHPPWQRSKTTPKGYFLSMTLNCTW